jgi:hypothetical protein
MRPALEAKQPIGESMGFSPCQERSSIPDLEAKYPTQAKRHVGYEFTLSMKELTNCSKDRDPLGKGNVHGVRKNDKDKARC